MNTILIHPMLVHFPIALLMVGAMFSVLVLFMKKPDHIACVKKTACWIMCLGALSAIAAIASGFTFTHNMVGIMGAIRQTHIILAMCSLSVGLLTSVLLSFDVYAKRKIAVMPYLAAVCGLFTAVMIGVTGHYGGMMVFGL